MIKKLEGREDYVYWLQPVASNNVEEQIPAMRFRGHFWNLSLRVMKAIYRPVRLRKGFINQERAPYGGLKLRIPLALYQEKMRTQCRFHVSCDVMRMRILLKFGLKQALRNMDDAVSVKDRKCVHNASSKVTGVIQKMLAPLVKHEIGEWICLDGDETSISTEKAFHSDSEVEKPKEDIVDFVQSLQAEIS
jgi:hypothetical protein